jgi:hypothetical protein
VVVQEPTHEGAYVELMRVYALLGRRREALRQYERLRETPLKEFGTEPEVTTTRVQQEIWAGTFPPTDSPPAGFPAQEVDAPSGAGPKGVASRRHNLPLAHTSFVGRGRESLVIKRLLAMTRPLTLTGAGGCGKTRLALEVARDLVGAYPDGVWLVVCITREVAYGVAYANIRHPRLKNGPPGGRRGLVDPIACRVPRQELTSIQERSIIELEQ